MIPILIALIAQYSAITQPATPINRADINCMAKVIYHEARGEPLIGQSAVAWVLKNRVNNPRYPNTYCDAAYRPAAFTGLRKRKDYSNDAAWKQAVRVAILVHQNDIEDHTNGALYYINPKKVKNFPKHLLPQYAVKTVSLFNHDFYKPKKDA